MVHGSTLTLTVTLTFACCSRLDLLLILRLCSLFTSLQGWELASRLGVAKGDYDALAMSWLKDEDSQIVSVRHVGLWQELNVSGSTSSGLSLSGTSITKCNQ
jgi:hypothetical protein